VTTPTLSYGHGWLEDFLTATVSANWHAVAGAPDLTGKTFTNLYLDRGVIACAAAASGESCFWSYYDETGASNIGKSTATYTKILIRWGTSVTATGLGFKVGAVFTGGTAEGDPPDQWIVGTLTTPAYSANGFTTTSVTLTPGKTLDHIRLYAVSEKNANSESISIDFILVYKGIFQFPQLTGGIEQDFQNNFARIQAPGRIGNITQYLGCQDSQFHIFGDICYEDSGTYPAGSPSWRDGSMSRTWLIYGQFVRELIHTAGTDPWQWMTSDIADCKVTVDHATISQITTNDDIFHFDMALYEYRESGASMESYVERWELL
jgi:hypothetical protein